MLTPILSLIGLYAFVTALDAHNAIILARGTAFRNVIGDPIGLFTEEIQQERMLATVYLASPSTAELAALNAQEAKTSAALIKMTAALESSGAQSAASPTALSAIKTAIAVTSRLNRLRAEVSGEAISMATAQADYTATVITCFQVLSQAFQEMPDVTEVLDATSVVRIAEAEDILLRAQALFVGDELARSFTAADHAKFAELTGEYQGLLAEALTDLGPAYIGSYRQAADSAAAAELAALDSAIINTSVATAPAPAAQAGQSPQVGEQGTVPPVGAAAAERAALKQISAYNAAVTAVATGLSYAGYRAGNTIAMQLHAAAGPIDFRLITAGVLGLLAIGVSIAVSIWIGRGLVRQLYELRQEALELAQRRLPKVIARLTAGENVNVEAEAPSLASSKDEIGQVRGAFNTVQRAAIEAAAGQAMLRAGVSTVFRNLARRNQALLHQQLALLDSLEQGANNPAELERLFRIDHLATRMRRQSESLVVLAGDQPARGWTNPVLMVDVLRGAVAEVLDYSRVRVVCTSRAALVGHAVADVIHLIAELADNASAFSPGNTQVRVYGSQVVRGFAIEIEDRGMGMPAEVLDRINRLLADPPPFNLEESDRLGLYVAARLARRHGVKVLLRPSPFGGTTAVVLIPQKLIVSEEVNRRGRPSAPESNGQPVPNGQHAVPPFYRTGRHASRNGAPMGADPQQAGRRIRPSQEAHASVGKAAETWEARDSMIENLPRRSRQVNLPPELRRPPAGQPGGTRTPSRGARPRAGLGEAPDPQEIRAALSAFQRGQERAKNTVANGQ